MAEGGSPHRSVLIDTHALLWWIANGTLLSVRAAEAVAKAEQVLISPITFWEISMLVAKGRIALDRSTVAWTNDVLARERSVALALTPEIAVDAGQLQDFHGDPADRMLAASASAANVPLVTKDRRMRAWAKDHPTLSCIW